MPVTLDKAPVAARVTAPPPAPDPAFHRQLTDRLHTDRLALWVAVSALVFGAVLRLWGIGHEPLHHDEAVNGWFLDNLLTRGEYRYDPQNYHGPFLFYFHTVVFAWFGEGVLGMRVPVALAGLAVIALVWVLRDGLGRWGAAFAMWLLATSPALVYYNRLFIHESYLCAAFVAVAVVWVAYRRWPQPALWLTLGVLVGWSLTLKETDIVTYGVLAIAAVLAWGFAFGWGPASDLWLARWLRGAGDRVRLDRLERQRHQLGDAILAAGGLLSPQGAGAGRLLAVSILLALAVVVAFYVRVEVHGQGADGGEGAGGLRVSGLLDKVLALAIWADTGFSDFHAKPPWYFFRFMATHEFAVAAAVALGAPVALWQRRFVPLLFAGWGIGLLLAYSIPSYKTPWLIMSPLTLLAIAGGQGLAALHGWLWPRVGQTLALLAALALPMGGAVVAVLIAHLPFEPPAPGAHGPSRPYADSGYIYAHSYTSARVPFDALDALGTVQHPPHVETLDVGLWPLPWYVRHIANHTYHYKDQPPDHFTGDIILADDAQAEIVLQRLVPGVEYLHKRFPVRPGLTLLVVHDAAYDFLFRPR